MIATGRPQSSIRGPTDALIYGVTQPERRVVLGPILTYRRYAGEEAGPGIAGGLEGQHFVRKSDELIARAAVPEAVVVRVTVHHAGHDRHRGVIQRLDRGPLWRGYVRPTAGGGDVVVAGSLLALVNHFKASQIIRHRYQQRPNWAQPIPT